MTSRFDLKAAERRLSRWESGEGYEADLAMTLIPAIAEIRRLMGVVLEAHATNVHQPCACPDCAAWRATTKETT